MSQTWILVVEDEGIVATDIQERLNRLGYAATFALNGPDALRKIAERVPDLVLMDILLSGSLDGVETALEIRKRFNGPIVFLTAYTDDAVMTRAAVAKPFGFVVKPFDEIALHAIIQRALSPHPTEAIESDDAGRES